MALRHAFLIALVATSTVSAFSWLHVVKEAWRAKEVVVAGVAGVGKCIKGVKDYVLGRKEASDLQKREMDQYALDLRRSEVELEKAKYHYDSIENTNNLERLRIHGDVAISKMNNAKDITVAAIDANSRENRAKTIADTTSRVAQLATIGFIVHRGIQYYETCKYNELELQKIDADLEKERMNTQRIVAESETKRQEAVSRAKDISAKEHAEKTVRMEKRHATEKETMSAEHERESEMLKADLDDKEKTIAKKKAEARRSRDDRLNDIDQHDHRMRVTNENIGNVLEDAERAIHTAQQRNSNLRLTEDDAGRISGAKEVNTSKDVGRNGGGKGQAAVAA